MATLIKPGEKPRAIKNLGWLLRHWAEVESLGFNYSPAGMNDGQLVAKMRDGSVYLTDYASLEVCWNWLNRPVFQGVPFRVYNMSLTGREQHEVKPREFLIGNHEFNRINGLPYKEQLEAILTGGTTEN